MTRIFIDDDLMRWEAYGTSGDYGFGDENSRIIFHCLSDPDQPPRVHGFKSGEADIERRVNEADPAELLALFKAAEVLG